MNILWVSVTKLKSCSNQQTRKLVFHAYSPKSCHVCRMYACPPDTLTVGRAAFVSTLTFYLVLLFCTHSIFSAAIQVSSNYRGPIGIDFSIFDTAVVKITMCQASPLRRRSLICLINSPHCVKAFTGCSVTAKLGGEREMGWGRGGGGGGVIILSRCKVSQSAWSEGCVYMVHSCVCVCVCINVKEVGVAWVPTTHSLLRSAVQGKIRAERLLLKFGIVENATHRSSNLSLCFLK